LRVEDLGSDSSISGSDGDALEVQQPLGLPLQNRERLIVVSEIVCIDLTDS
jgi:hypothetical protein